MPPFDIVKVPPLKSSMVKLPSLALSLSSYDHSLTDKGLKAFLDDWAKTGQSILPK